MKTAGMCMKSRNVLAAEKLLRETPLKNTWQKEDDRSTGEERRMIIKASDVDNIIVLLNGRPLKMWHAANDDEGWVDIPYLGDPADLISQKAEVDYSSPEPCEFPLKRHLGEVKFVTIR
jgi:hypothetical protein